MPARVQAYNDSVAASVGAGHDGPEALLARCVPLHRHGTTVSRLAAASSGYVGDSGLCQHVEPQRTDVAVGYHADMQGAETTASAA